LFVNNDLLDHACATLLYSASNLSYRQIIDIVKELPMSRKEQIVEFAFKHRGDHDLWVRELQSQPLTFDITMDIGGFRDFNRHRKVSKILQSLDPDFGYSVPAPLDKFGLEKEYKSQMESHFSAVRSIRQAWDSAELSYLLPLSTNCRSLHQMDLAQAAYVIELRTKSAGHFSYREVAYQMYLEIERKFPWAARNMRVTNPSTHYDPFER